MTYYIYKIENKVNHKIYIGLTNNIVRRRNRHFTDLNCNRHDNKFLQKEFNQYGKENFEFSIELQGDYTPEEISQLEQQYIQKYDSFQNGYNQNEGGNFGPTNGGSHLIESDIYNILAALEFMSRPGTILGKIYEVSNTTISRIKKGENHTQYKEKYDRMPLDIKKQIYKDFCESTNFIEDKVNTTIIKSKRKLTEQQVHLILVNEEKGRIVPINYFMVNFGINSSNTIYTVINGKSYKDYALTYKKLTQVQKEKLVSLLSNQ